MGELHKYAYGGLFAFAKHNRRKATEAEIVLWQYLRSRRLCGFKFRRQHPVDGFVADFYCHQAKLIIEVDGDYHREPKQQSADDIRSRRLNDLGFHVIRVTNTEVLQNIDWVISQLRECLEKQSH